MRRLDNVSQNADPITASFSFSWMTKIGCSMAWWVLQNTRKSSMLTSPSLSAFFCISWSTLHEKYYFNIVSKRQVQVILKTETSVASIDAIRAELTLWMLRFHCSSCPEAPDTSGESPSPSLCRPHPCHICQMQRRLKWIKIVQICYI